METYRRGHLQDQIFIIEENRKSSENQPLERCERGGHLLKTPLLLSSLVGFPVCAQPSFLPSVGSSLFSCLTPVQLLMLCSDARFSAYVERALLKTF